MPRPSTDKSRAKQVRTRLNKIKKAFPQSKPLIEHIRILKMQLRNKATKGAAKTLDAIEQLICDGGIFSQPNQTRMRRKVKQ